MRYIINNNLHTLISRRGGRSGRRRNDGNDAGDVCAVKRSVGRCVGERVEALCRGINGARNDDGRSDIAVNVVGRGRARVGEGAADSNLHRRRADERYHRSSRIRRL